MGAVGRFAWRTTKIAGAIAAVASALLALGNLFNIGEPWWIATRGYVRAEVTAAVQQAQKLNREQSARIVGLEISIGQAERSRLLSAIDRNTIELARAPAGTDALRREIETQIRLYREQVRLFEAELEERERQRKQFQ